jgi:hypothetical protein
MAVASVTSARACLLVVGAGFAGPAAGYAALLMPLVADLAPPALRGRYMATTGLSWWLGLAIAPTLGTQLLSVSPPDARLMPRPPGPPATWRGAAPGHVPDAGSRPNAPHGQEPGDHDRHPGDPEDVPGAGHQADHRAQLPHHLGDGDEHGVRRAAAEGLLAADHHQGGQQRGWPPRRRRRRSWP